ncbi:Fe-S protein assembly co-chaperone HscB [Gemmata sp. JC673]|uniref:Fe-S protein assembly co-chaperone HscB n=1 Tax=Gemmata algarum TaxID=2975278 RepID=A0ABU5F0P7_9BACT|nr:Fe-S protein assembly co-chaperone HscB [Gemmata algarum]MDY3560310.1 Fe-S protein assembly co-chaperone HscB [Gemmata algarum]
MTDYFHRLGLPRRFAVDAADLERAYFARSRAVHPDYHLAGSSADLNASLDLSAALNEAYNNLRDPFLRAEYLLGLMGGPSAAEQKQMPPAFLAEMLDAREELEAARGSPTKTEQLEQAFGSRLAGILDDVAAAFGRLEPVAAGSPERVNLLARIRGLLNAARYIRGLIRDLNAE